MGLPPAAGRLATTLSAPSKVRIVGLFAAVVGSLALSAAAGARPDRSQAGYRLTGAIEVHANLAQDSLSLTLSSRAQFDVTLTTNPDEFATVPMAYDWTGVSGSCRWEGTGSNGELRLRLVGIRAGRPLVEFNGFPLTLPEGCNGYHASPPSFFLYTGDDDERDGITPQVYWGAEAGSVEGRGTGTLSLQCAGCGAPAGGAHRVRALWGGTEFTPPKPRTGRLVRMTQNVLLLEKGSRDTAWNRVDSANVKVKCVVYYTRSKRNVRKATVRGRLRGGAVSCGPWRIPTSARGSVMSVAPLLTFRGKTVTPAGGRGSVLVRLPR